jgi:hypothetical protein
MLSLLRIVFKHRVIYCISSPLLVGVLGRAIQAVALFSAHSFISHYDSSLLAFVCALCVGTGLIMLILQAFKEQSASAVPRHASTARQVRIRSRCNRFHQMSSVFMFRSISVWIVAVERHYSVCTTFLFLFWTAISGSSPVRSHI